MKIENLDISFQLANISSVPMSALQRDYFQILKQEKSIAKTVYFYYQQGWLTNFSELYALIYNLTQAQVITNPEFIEYFKNLILKSEPGKNDLPPEIKTREIDLNIVRSLPFFRSLRAESLNFMLANSKTYSLSPRTMVLHEGGTDRDMYVLLRGQVGIYKKNINGERFRVATLIPGCLFGEYGFFLNEPRLADVVALNEVQVLKITYIPEVFDQWIRKEVAESLKHRFWVIHGIMRSPILSILPEDTTDQLIHRGQLKTVAANEILFKERTPGHFFYILIQGSMTILQNGKTINVLNAGDSFGELSLFVNQGIRTATIRAQTDCIVLEISSQDFYALMAENLFLAKEIEKLAYTRLKNDQKRFGER
ncbi:MAG: cyclic nucleotide-binding domain-containing protein [Bdellovibrionaceae bacterium]|nr:cyclic nucleotide-binding domain-containing protein [Pseudobdellovibrionaceae bacterium]